MPKVSVIIPVYNVEQYIERCARSLFEQTLEDIELIFVNDCTQDNSMAVLSDVIRDYPKRSEQIKIVNHTVNKGLPTARRSGLDVATGDYVIHCDSDDWIDRTMYEKLYRKAEESHCDMTICGYFESNGHDILSTYDVSDFKTESLSKAIMLDQIKNFLWNKLIKKELIDKLDSWPVDNLFEDAAVVMSITPLCQSIGVVDEPLYYYFQNPSGICLSKNNFIKLHQATNNLNFAFTFIERDFGRRKFRKEMFHRKCLLKTFFYDVEWREYVSTFPEVNLSLLFDPHLPVPKKLGHITKCLGIHGISKAYKSVAHNRQIL